MNTLKVVFNGITVAIFELQAKEDFNANGY